MFPVNLDLTYLPVALIGNGARTARRLALLDEDGAENLTVYAPSPSGELARTAGGRLQRRWPTPAEIAGTRLVLVADGVEPEVVRDLVATARAAGTLVNVEDRPEFCDFHSPAMVRRGDLLLTVSTGGRSPRLAHRIGSFLGQVFGPEWQRRLEELGALRALWREAGADSQMVSAWTDAWVDRHGELPGESETKAAAAEAAASVLAAPI
ncbi:MAG TPA: NAD(P)-dependent oxidoreductase [Stellaceae bacterium]|nr:NAD(P)-dependent oxidoreductase [Stellaceae bacterium]